MSEIHTLKWDHGRAEVQSLAAMLGPVYFKLGAREVQPFAIMPWGEDTGADHAALPGILQRTRGEWPCVPFGAPNQPEGLPENWQSPMPHPVCPDFHGFSANNQWELLDKTESTLRLGIVYPDNHPIERVEREVMGVAGEPALRCILRITARVDVTLPIALHPCFALSKKPKQTEIIADFDFGKVLPMQAEKGVSRLLPDAELSELGAIGQLPLAYATEEIVQLCGAKGPIALLNHGAGYRVDLDYDQSLFPSVLLWVSNRGRSEYPWLSRFEGVGIEPLCGAFDLGPDVSNWAENPIAKRGIATAISLKAGQTITTEYGFRVSELAS